MKLRHQLLAEIANFRPWRGPALAPGVAGFLHKPVLQRRFSGNNNGHSLSECVACMCGGCHPQKQTLEEELNEVMLHIAERQREADRAFVRAEETYLDMRSGA